MYTAALQSSIISAVDHIDNEMSKWSPLLHSSVNSWIEDYYNTEDLSVPFTHPRAFPMLLFPWWLEQSISGNHDTEFQKLLIISTICGYQYIRIMDNVMDENSEQERKLLPALNIYHTLFYNVYTRYFESSHEFWDEFKKIWFSSAEFTFADDALTDIDESMFHSIAAQKTSAALIPLLAVAHKYNEPDRYLKWKQFVIAYGSYHQMYNDLFDWQKDLKNNNHTYLLCEARRQKDENESETSWFIKHGLSWAVDLLNNWLSDLQDMAAELQCAGLQKYLTMRHELLKEKSEALSEDLKKSAQLIEMLQKFGARI